ncbi:MAG: hypothetical protein ACJ786_20385 [Catenulispora sp.]
MVGALVAGIPLLLTRSSGGSGLGAAHEALHAPANLDGFTPMVGHSKINPAMNKRTESSETMSAKNLSDAYGGAASTVRQYVDAGLENFVALEAVRATSPKPFVPYVDAASIGLAKPQQEVVTIGQTSCVVANDPAPTGQQESPDQVHVVICERTSPHLTVRLRFTGGGDRSHSPQDAAALTERAWAALS